MDQVLSAIEKSGLPAVITYPNADMGGRAIIEKINSFQERYPLAQARVSLGSRLYMGLMRHVAALVGNSSSGIIEAASFGLPVVNVGDRQLGRIRGANVIDVAGCKEVIYAGIQQAMDPEFRRIAADVSNPYDKGNASEIIVPVLKDVPLDSTLLRKRLVDLPSTLEALKVGETV
jgi:UDP-N-acetylglucosamine 2-epimerase